MFRVRREGYTIDSTHETCLTDALLYLCHSIVERCYRGPLDWASAAGAAHASSPCSMKYCAASSKAPSSLPKPRLFAILIPGLPLTLPVPRIIVQRQRARNSPSAPENTGCWLYLYRAPAQAEHTEPSVTLTLSHLRHSPSAVCDTRLQPSAPLTFRRLHHSPSAVCDTYLQPSATLKVKVKVIY